MVGVGLDRVLGDARAAVGVQGFAGVGVYVEPREVAAGDIEADAVAERW